MNFAENGTFSDQRGETGTWLVNATGEIEAQWANNTSLVITPTAYTEDIKRYEIEWKVDNSQAITSVAYMRNAASLSFTSQELWGNTFYYAWYATAADCNVPGYVIEPISFASNGAYTLDNCDSDILENGTYNILENGNLRINFGEGEFVKKIAYNADIGGWLHCYEQVDSALCATNETGYFVTSQADAQAYIDSKSN
ncbi:hypothetical protein RS130_01565 [Paraglaciecola aquimarina]|uniref:Uncharacterized protein n=1 Tax=Paraglaciecola aquimarina TaxID=1235557 RepID=A0ABU3SS26_9ALTE|nr:hypothetical protein [Paraglaciecola aquimarina]MDU0352785.1 hypothetical protein [Paraglaciecola aquimarina]